ncbi:MAG: OmpA family protein [Bacteroidetes bacterium]|nr:OmpA family protein [Bacteroidota bacterium]
MRVLLTFLFLTLIIAAQSQVAGRTVYFESGKSELKPADKKWIDSVCIFLSAAESYSVKLSAYCDGDGSPESNDLLAQARAKAVKDVFTANKLNEKFIASNSFGENDPVADNATEQGKARNRRAMVAITYKLPAPAQAAPAKEVIADVPAEKKNDAAPSVGLSSEGLEVGKKMILKNLNFEGGTAVLLVESEPALKELLKFMQDHPTIEIEIGGHVCCGPEMELSVMRAQKVYNYLKNYGISEKRMTYKGYSFDKPIASERTEEGKRANRRVEITILKM